MPLPQIQWLHLHLSLELAARHFASHYSSRIGRKNTKYICEAPFLDFFFSTSHFELITCLSSSYLIAHWRYQLVDPMMSLTHSSMHFIYDKCHQFLPRIRIVLRLVWSVQLLWTPWNWTAFPLVLILKMHVKMVQRKYTQTIPAQDYRLCLIL